MYPCHSAFSIGDDSACRSDGSAGPDVFDQFDRCDSSDTPTRAFTRLLASTRLGARLARRLCVAELRRWEVPADVVERAELVVAELASNAVLHAREPGSPLGRVFRLGLVFVPAVGRLRVEVSDARGDLWPHGPATDGAGLGDAAGVVGGTGVADPETAVALELNSNGRGLALVSALTDRWDTIPRPPTGKTVRAYLSPTDG